MAFNLGIFTSGTTDVCKRNTNEKGGRSADFYVIAVGSKQLVT